MSSAASHVRNGSALAGIRVVECGLGVSAPFCARIFADLGAEVAKVEPPGGDPARTFGPFAPGAETEYGALFAFLNAGKQCIRLSGDPASDGRRIAALAAGADVLVTNVPPAERPAWGLDLDSLAAAYPALVIVVLSALGETGPLAEWRAYEIHVSALSGASAILGEPGKPPLHFPYDLPALQAGLHGAAAALAALLARRRSGCGQRVEVAEADVMAFYCGGMSLFVLGSGGKWRRRGLERHGFIYPSGFYPCKDGYVFLASQTREQWRNFLRCMGEPEWARQDPALQDGVAIGWRRADEVDVHFIPWLTQFTRRELVKMAREANLVLGPINTPDELLGEPHLEARRFWTPYRLGSTSVRLPGMGYTMSATPWRLGPLPETRRDGPCWEPRPQPQAPEARPPRRPLEGYRAIEFGFNWAGPMVGQILADLGMEVIKVETRKRLDFMRHWAHARRFFHNANRGKRSVAINVKKPEGVDLVRRLVAHADVVFDNFAAGVMVRNGLDYEALRAAKPDIIALSMAMAGQSGPLRHLRGFATIATGFAGLEALVGYPETGPTGLQLLGIGDVNAAIQAVIAVLAALWYRENTGTGQFIDLSQIEAAATLVAEPLCECQLRGEPPARRGNRHPRMAPHGVYPAAGREQWVAIAVGSDAEWRALVEAMGEPEWACSETLARAPGRCARAEELDARLSEWTASFLRDELVERLQKAGVASAPVLGIEEVFAHPHFRARGLWDEVEYFEGGKSLVCRTPWQFSASAATPAGPSPRVGEHTEAVLGELLHLDAAEIQRLAERGVTW